MEKVKYTTSSRFYNKHSGKLFYVDNLDSYCLKAAVKEAGEMLESFSEDGLTVLNPCNISVRGKGGRFVKWRNK